MSDFLRFLLSSAGALLSLLAAIFWIACRPRSTAARRTAFIVAIGYGLASIYAVPATVGRVLSAGYHPFTVADAPTGRTAIVVLGSGAGRVQGWDQQRVIEVTPGVEAARVLEAWRVFHLIAPAVIVASGGLPNDDDPSPPSGRNIHDELVRLGVPEARILVETISRNTHDESVIVAPMLRAHGIEHIVLVTSDVHMRRSLAVFRAQGWNAVPAIAPDPGRFATAWGAWFLPSDDGLSMSQQVMHEILGLPYYWVRGWERF